MHKDPQDNSRINQIKVIENTVFFSEQILKTVNHPGQDDDIEIFIKKQFSYQNTNLRKMSIHILSLNQCSD